MEFNIRENFEPSKWLKNFSLFTYKDSYDIGAGLEKPPGLFQVNWLRYIGYLIGVAIIAGIEYWAYKQVKSRTDASVILGAILIDILFALVAHIGTNKIQKLKNDLFLETNKDSQDGIKDAIGRQRIWRYIGITLISLSTAVKLYFTLKVLTKAGINILFLMMTAYVVGSILHIICTGYFVFETIFHLRFWYEHVMSRGRAKGKYMYDRGKYEEKVIEMGNIVVTEHNNHKIIQKEDGSFCLQTKGLLTDTELAVFVTRQKEDESKKLVARAGVSRQLDLLNTEPNAHNA